MERFIYLYCTCGHMKQTNSILSEEIQYLQVREVAQTKELAKKFTCSKKTILRRLKDVGYLKSYNKNGSFITLKNRPNFDEHGLWHYKGAFFSKWKTIPETICHLIDVSVAGYTAGELERLLQVELYHQLTACLNKAKIYCDKRSPRPIYYAIDILKRDEQVQHRTEMTQQTTLELPKVSRENTLKILVVALRHQTANIKKLLPLLELEGVFVVESQVEWVFDTYNIKKNDSHWNS